MSRVSYADLVEQVYRLNPNATDDHVSNMVVLNGGRLPVKKTLDYWKTLCRKRGVDIPDQRRRITPNE